MGTPAVGVGAVPGAVAGAAIGILVTFGIDVVIKKAGGKENVNTRGVQFWVNIAETVTENLPVIGFFAHITAPLRGRYGYSCLDAELPTLRGVAVCCA